jgi:glycosyltransferase involved in cell wall biosynthesis
MISVIIPTYQSPEALDLCLKSAIEGQVNKNQIIVVVDGFYDINKEVLERYVEHIEILHLENNVGLCRGTNLGVYNAEHERILIVNDDNVFPKAWDIILEVAYNPNFVISPNQIEPRPSMFPQFNINDLGTDPKTFDLKEFWDYSYQISQNLTEDNGSTLPIFMSREKYIALGGWDENYSQGMVADWDFFLKCQLMGLTMMRTYNCHFYHFASVSVNGEKRRQAEMDGHEYARYKWGAYLKHNPQNNLKYL